MTRAELENDKRVRREKISYEQVASKYRSALSRNEELEAEVEAMKAITSGVETYHIIPKKQTGNSEAVAFMIASDWHAEETVTKASVNGLNEYTLAIAEKRAMRFFQNGLRLLQICRKDVSIDTVVLGLLGDFLSGNIHDELLETCSLQPIEATMLVQKWIASGIEFLLKHTNCKLIIPCCPGNHSRITKKQRHATEAGNSLETFMYHSLAQYFQKEKRVQFIIAEGYHTYLDVYNMTVRFHHGHAIRYQGGIGGLTIPANKAIAQWNKAKRADLEIFGHWHQFFDAGNFICNGSNIGFNAFALSIKASYEPPRQAFFILDRKRGKTIVAPILTEA